MRLLVTGGAGFIGSHVVERALGVGLEVAVLDNFATGRSANVPQGVTVLNVDLRNRLELMHAIGSFKPDLVSHHAAQISVPQSFLAPHIDAEVNVVGGINLLDACVAYSVKRVVFASSGGAVYGDVLGFTTYAHETHPVAPISPYGVHKLAFEHLLQVYRERHGLQSVVLRYANVYGPRQSAQGEAGVVDLFLRNAARGTDLKVFGQERAGDGGCVRDYVFVRDVANINWIALLDDELAFRVMNVATGYATSTLQLAELVRKITRTKSQISHDAPRAGDVARSVLSPVRMTEVAGAPVLLEDGLRDTWDWHVATWWSPGWCPITSERP